MLPTLLARCRSGVGAALETASAATRVASASTATASWCAPVASASGDALPAAASSGLCVRPYSVTLPTPSTGPEDELYVGAYTPITKNLWRARHAQGNSGYRPAPPDSGARPPKPTSVVYEFSTDRALQDMYRNPWGNMRLGRLLEDLDSLAGNVAFEHCYTGGTKPLLVTASVDEIALQHPLKLEREVVVRGQVVWVGKSSLDIRMQLFQEQHAPAPSLEALFSFVQLDPATRKAAPVVPLVPQLPVDVEAFAQRQAVADARRLARQQGGASGAPALPAEAREWVRAAQRMQELPALAEAGAILLPHTRQQNTFVCQPQHRNTHGRVFGGFLMRRAFELGFATSYMFGGARPSFHKVDEITFARPVDVGDLLRLSSSVLHSENLPGSSDKGRVVVEVEARVTKPEQRDSFVTNTFLFAFNVSGPPGKPLQLRRVLPTTDEEAARCWRARQV
ncbi:hypothetical protein HYH03_005754 [Edaphochlamys debaryana]|uniref:HotDog ACOT-type domain-containing protein n=1 Tax=Edaphochlamys debaryana TaxID=47281 RepID=A0A836C1S3_9CHLO|nr:hypothetical protein HYH03_005754 [Edaphochlamys debaryana]|eukprot:KAG2496152.1 hypothetical protein HYH03_005754 [Edaphochlamys debaryana]